MSQSEQFESQFEEKLYAQRQEKLEAIRALGLQLGLTAAEAVYPNRFPAADEPIQLSHIPDLLEHFDNPNTPISAELLEAGQTEVAVAGRLMSLRVQGKAGFAHLQGGGKRLQIYVRKDDVGETVFALYKLLDLGDHIGVRGHLMRTRTGELTLKATPLPDNEGQLRPALSFLTKAMLALPDKYHGLEDVELRYRQRYVDLIMNSGTLIKAEPQGSPGAPSSPAASSPVRVGDAAMELPPGTSTVTDTALPNEEPNDTPLNVREVFEKRAKVLKALRRFFDSRGYIEVETPMLHTVAGGAAAKPFTTHHNALDIPLNLRIAPELFLKRLVVGGLDRVYEINRNFRNEGVSTRHNPEFTMLEFYQAYANYHDLMELTQELIQFVAMEVNGTTKTHFNGYDIDLSQWQMLSMRGAIEKWWPSYSGPQPTFEILSDSARFEEFIHPAMMALIEVGVIEVSDSSDTKETKLSAAMLLPVLDRARQAFGEAKTRLGSSAEERRQALAGVTGRAIAEVFETVAEPHLIQPTIIYDFPLAVSPLSKVKPDEPDWVERFEFYIGGFEVGNAFSELNDPIDQRNRFESQVADKDPESMAEVDEDYVRALGYGLPPTAGEGIGIDRLTMILTGSRSIRDVILFPLMRPRTTTPEETPSTATVPSPS